MFELISHRRFKKELLKLEFQIQKRINEVLDKLKAEPRIGERLSGHPYWRIRVGDYRIIYEILDKENKILLIMVGHRKNIYGKINN